MSEAEHAHANRPLGSTDYQVVFQLTRLQQCVCVSMYKAHTYRVTHIFIYVHTAHEAEWKFTIHSSPFSKIYCFHLFLKHAKPPNKVCC